MAHRFSLARPDDPPHSPADTLRIAMRAGYTHASLRLADLAAAAWPFLHRDRAGATGEVRAILEDNGIRVLDLEGAPIDAFSPLDTFLPLLETAARLGARHVVARIDDAEHERATEAFARLCDRALPFRLTVELSCVHGSATPRLAAAAAVVGAINRPNAGILIDTLDFTRAGDEPEELRRLPKEWFHLVRVRDATSAGSTTNCPAVVLPGEGSVDLRGILDALPAGLPYALVPPRGATAGAEEGWARRCILAARDCMDGLHGIRDLQAA